MKFWRKSEKNSDSLKRNMRVSFIWKLFHVFFGGLINCKSDLLKQSKLLRGNATYLNTVSRSF